MSDYGYRALAAAILVRAIRDANGDMGKDVRAPQRKEFCQSGKDFLRPENALFEVCCDLLDYNPAVFAEAAKLRGSSITREARMADAAARKADALAEKQKSD